MRKNKYPEWFNAKAKDAKMFMKIWTVVGGIVIGIWMLFTLPPLRQNYALDFAQELMSPSGTHIARWYHRSGGGAAGFVDQRGHIIDVATGQSRPVVHTSRRALMVLDWIDDSNVMFNDTRINVSNRGLRANEGIRLARAGGVYILAILLLSIHIERLHVAKRRLENERNLNYSRSERSEESSA